MAGFDLNRTRTRFDFTRIFETRRKLYDRLVEFTAVLMQGDDFKEVAAITRVELGIERAKYETVVESMRYLVGQTLTSSLIWELSWRLAANIGPLKKGVAILPWTRQTKQEWVPLQIIGVRYHLRRQLGETHGRPGRMFRFQILAGSPASMVITQFWQNDKIDVIAYHTGFKRKPPYIKTDHSELMSFRFLGSLEPRLCSRGPGFFKIRCPGGMEKYNRELIQMRRRIDFECPNGYNHECHECPIGVRSCPSAVHPEDYVVRRCASCKKEVWFDTDTGYVNDHCVNCQPWISSGFPVPLPIIRANNALRSSGHGGQVSGEASPGDQPASDSNPSDGRCADSGAAGSVGPDIPGGGS